MLAARCASAGVPSSPEPGSPRSRRSVLALVLIAVIAGLGVLALGWCSEDDPADRYPVAAQSMANPFPDASASRVFLTSQESTEAARRELLPAGTRSILGTAGKLDYGGWRWDDKGVPAGPVAIRVDLERQLVSVFQGNHEVGTAVIVYGMEGKETPRGRLPILGKTRDYHSITYDAPMPYSLWLRRDGVALHGSSVRMGRATNGCIGVPVKFAAKLFEIAEKGDVVEVIGNPTSG